MPPPPVCRHLCLPSCRCLLSSTMTGCCISASTFPRATTSRTPGPPPLFIIFLLLLPPTSFVPCGWGWLMRCLFVNIGSGQRQVSLTTTTAMVWQCKLAFLSLIFKLTELILLSSLFYCKQRIQLALGSNSHSSSGPVAQCNQISWWLQQWLRISIKPRGK